MPLFSICSLLKVFPCFCVSCKCTVEHVKEAKDGLFFRGVHRQASKIQDGIQSLLVIIISFVDFFYFYFLNLLQLLPPVRQCASSLFIRELQKQKNRNSKTKRRPLSAADTLRKKQIQLVGEEATAPQRHVAGLQSSNAINS